MPQLRRLLVFESDYLMGYRGESICRRAPLTAPPCRSHHVRMGVETIGEAYRVGWRIKVRCAFGTRDGMKSIRECKTRADLDLKTLVGRGAMPSRSADWRAGLNAPTAGRGA